MQEINLIVDNYTDIVLDGKIILHINKNDEGYSFDVYIKKFYDNEAFDHGFVCGTWCRHEEIEEWR